MFAEPTRPLHSTSDLKKITIDLSPARDLSRVHPHGELDWKFEIAVLDPGLQGSSLNQRIRTAASIQPDATETLAPLRSFGKPVVLFHENRGIKLRETNENIEKCVTYMIPLLKQSNQVPPKYL